MVVVFDSALFDPEFAEGWGKSPPPPGGVDVAADRVTYRKYFQEVSTRTCPTSGKVSVEDISVRVGENASVTVRLYRPEVHESGRALLYLHGGSFYLGDLDFEDGRCRAIADGANCFVASVDYRLAPEYRYPVPLEDCYKVMEWLTKTAGFLSIDRNRIAVGGCSAGGALAAGVAQLCCDRGVCQPKMQMLLYPVLDSSLSSYSMRLSPEDARRGLQLMWDRYLGDIQCEVPAYASPLQRKVFEGLPPAYIGATQLDPLRDEAILYAQALWNAGVYVELHVWPRVPHAFDLFVPEATVSRQAIKEQAGAIVRFLG
jgi:acetyl esterase